MRHGKNLSVRIRIRIRDAPAFGSFAYLGEALVKSAAPDELVMAAGFGNASVVDHKDLVGIAYRGQTVGDGDDRFAARQL